MNTGEKLHQIIVNTILVVMLALVYLFAVSDVFQNESVLTASPVYRGLRDGKEISILCPFEDEGDMLISTAEKARKYGLFITFFFTPQWIEENREYLLRVEELGHEIELMESGIQTQTESADALIRGISVFREACGKPPKLLFPIEGRSQDGMTSAAREHGLAIVLGSYDLTQKRAENSMVLYQTMSKAAAGDMIVLPHQCLTTEHLELISDCLLKRDLHCVTAQRLLCIAKEERD